MAGRGAVASLLTMPTTAQLTTGACACGTERCARARVFCVSWCCSGVKKDKKGCSDVCLPSEGGSPRGLVMCARCVRVCMCVCQALPGGCVDVLVVQLVNQARGCKARVPCCLP